MILRARLRAGCADTQHRNGKGHFACLREIQRYGDRRALRERLLQTVEHEMVTGRRKAHASPRRQVHASHHLHARDVSGHDGAVNHCVRRCAARGRDERVRGAAFVDEREIDRAGCRTRGRGARPSVADANVSAARLRRCRNSISRYHAKERRDGCDLYPMGYGFDCHDQTRASIEFGARHRKKCLTPIILNYSFASFALSTSWASSPAGKRALPERNRCGSASRPSEEFSRPSRRFL